MKNIHTLRQRATDKLMRKALREMVKAPSDLKASDKVKFSERWINESAFYKSMNENRRAYVEAHKEDVFTLAYDEGKEGSSTLFVFEEDDNETKWLWHASELTKVEVNE